MSAARPPEEPQVSTPEQDNPYARPPEDAGRPEEQATQPSGRAAGPYDPAAGPYDKAAGPYGQDPGPYDQARGPYDAAHGGYPAPPPLGYGVAGLPIPESMPGRVTAARVMLFVMSGLGFVGAILILFAAAVTQSADEEDLRDNADLQQLQDMPSGLIYGMGVFCVLWAAAALLLGVRFGAGGGTVRTLTFVWAGISAVLGIWPFVGLGLVFTVLCILVIVFCATADGSRWFSRPRP